MKSYIIFPWFCASIPSLYTTTKNFSAYWIWHARLLSHWFREHENKILFKEFKFLHWHLGSLVSRPKVNFSITKSISSYGTRLNHTSIISELKLSFLQLRHGIISEEGVSRESPELYKRMITTNESNRNVLKLQNCVLQSQNLKNSVTLQGWWALSHRAPSSWNDLYCCATPENRAG